MNSLYSVVWCTVQVENHVIVEMCVCVIKETYKWKFWRIVGKEWQNLEHAYMLTYKKRPVPGQYHAIK